jgi:hypothetical protein
MAKRRTRLAAWIERHIVLPDVVAEPGSVLPEDQPLIGKMISNLAPPLTPDIAVIRAL